MPHRRIECFNLRDAHNDAAFIARPKYASVLLVSSLLSWSSNVVELLISRLMNNKRTYRDFQKAELRHGRVSRAECLHLRRYAAISVCHKKWSTCFVGVLYFIILLQCGTLLNALLPGVSKRWHIWMQVKTALRNIGVLAAIRVS